MSIVTYALQNNLIQIIKLVNHGTNINEIDHYRCTALMEASRYGHFKIVKYLVQHNCLINEKSSNGDTALMMASSNGYFEIVKYLVQHNAKMNEKNAEDTELIIASYYGYFKIVKYLVHHNAKINKKDLFGHTSIGNAYIRGHFEIVKFFKSVTLKRIKFYKK